MALQNKKQNNNNNNNNNNEKVTENSDNLVPSLLRKGDQSLDFQKKKWKVCIVDLFEDQ